MLRVHASALKHGCSRDDVSHAHDMAVHEIDLPQDDAPPKLLIIGPDDAGNMLELIGGFVEDDDPLIWHAMPCRAEYLDLLPQTGGDA